jgi:PiT family inorganic phosphate transporter
LVIVLAALIGAIVWNLGTWWLGLPSSSTHALIGGLIGAALAASQTVKWNGLVDKVVIPMVLSPLVGFVGSYLFMLALLWAFRKANAHRAQRGFRWAQIASAATMAFGHGTQDAQKTMGVIFTALVVSGHIDSAKDDIPLWVILTAALAIALGTYSGGWRIMRTLGRRIISLTPASGFAAQTVASAVMLANAQLGFPVSTTHVISSSIMGVGATRRLSAVRWGVAGNIVVAWILTIPAAAAVAALVWAGLNPLLT